MTTLRIAVCFLLGIVLSSCGNEGQSVERSVKSWEVFSTPYGCVKRDAQGLVTTPSTTGVIMCLNTIDPSTYIRTIDYDNSIVGFEPKWGTSYKVTFEEVVTTTRGTHGNVQVTRNLISIDESIQDPIGTVYINETESSYGGLKAIDHSSEGFYEIMSTPVLCSEEICGIENRFENITRGVAQFKLVEYNGNRHIQAFHP